MPCLICGNEDYSDPTKVCKKCGLRNIPRQLVDWEIRKLINLGVLKIVPILNLEKQLNPNGFDICLDTKFRIIRKSQSTFIDTIKPFNINEVYDKVELLVGGRQKSFVLHPGDFVLAQSFEYIKLPNFISAGLDGKSSLGRLSLSIHTTAGSIDPGFKGHVTFELYNAGGLPIKVHPLQPIARLIFYFTEEVEKPYTGEYSHQSDVTPSMGYRSWMNQVIKLLTDKEVIP